MDRIINMFSGIVSLLMFLISITSYSSSDAIISKGTMEDDHGEIITTVDGTTYYGMSGDDGCLRNFEVKINGNSIVKAVIEYRIIIKGKSKAICIESYKVQG